MSPFQGNDIDPELVAAYFDGEFEGRDDTDALRRQVEAWLENCPEAQAQIADYRQLRQIWLATGPAEPYPSWPRVLQGVRQGLTRDPRRTAPRRSVWTRRLVAGAIAASLALAWLGWPRQVPPRPGPDRSGFRAVQDEEDLPYLVARADEIVILGMEGGDTDALVVGEPPVRGPLELATQEEIRVTNMQPDGGDRMVPRVVGQRPMIWAFLDSERE